MRALSACLQSCGRRGVHGALSDTFDEQDLNSVGGVFDCEKSGGTVAAGVGASAGEGSCLTAESHCGRAAAAAHGEGRLEDLLEVHADDTCTGPFFSA